MLKDALGSETVHRKTQVEPGKARARYFYLRHALVQAHDRSHDGKPEACASLAARTPFVDPIEAFEQMRQVLFRNTLAWIAYAEPDVLLLTVNLHHYSLPLWAVANGVGEQIGHCPLNHQAIALDHPVSVMTCSKYCSMASCFKTYQ